MENPEPERSAAPEEGGSLNRNRSFKSKQLVRSQAIRESQSPPRAASPASPASAADAVVAVVDGGAAEAVEEREEKRRPVEIQITGGSWEGAEQRARRRWPPQRDLLSNAPRVACVAGCRHSEQPCRGLRRRQTCPTKQDSGISCPDDCADCSDFEHTGGSSNDVRKACSLDDDSYCRCPDRRDMKPKNSSLIRTDSDLERAEPSGPELVKFIKETLNKNARDRMTLLKIEKELHALVNDTGRCIVKFPVMTSYGRMLVHRVAALFQLSHHLDQSGKNAVTVSKSGTCGGRIPCTSFKQWCTVNFPPSPVRHQDSINAKSILKRDTHSPDDSGANCRAVERSKSLEQREKEYERVRRRIFSEQENCCQDESQWPWLNAGPVKLLTPDSGRNKLLKVQSLESSGPQTQPWRRGAVSKSHSFGGYGAGADPPPQRLLSRQGDLASSSWRLSPSSSGYKTLSLRSTDSVTPSPTGGASPEPAPEGALVWAVTDLSSVPPGALVIHPQTGRPLTNADGSVYHFDPANPPVIYDASAYLQDQKIQNCEKRRGRLEKQHSFIDAEAECRCDDGRSKCCCECRHDACARAADDKVQSQQNQEPKSIPVPPSPVKNRYEQSTEPSANEQAPAEPTANQRPPYEPPTSQIAIVEPVAQQTEIVTNQVQVFEPNPTTFEPTINQRPYESSVPRFDNRTYVASPHQRPPSFDSTNQRPPSFEPTNQRPPSFESTNQRQPSFDSSNQRPPSFDSTNQRPPSFDATNQRPPSFESTNQRPPSFESTNQRPPSFESTNQRPPSFESVNQRPPSFDSANQRPPSFDSANHRIAAENAASQMQVLNKMTNQEIVEIQYMQHGYSKGYSAEEMMTPQLIPIMPDMTMFNTQAKLVAQATGGLRAVALPGHAEQPLQPLYQPMMQEEQKLAPSPLATDNTFRIDPSYPYPLQYSAACGACVGVEQPQHRGYNIGYAPIEQPMLQQPYQVGNVLLQHGVQHYPYQEAMQWAPPPLAPGKLLLHDLCPAYPHYQYLYPQMLPQPYPIMQPVYPAVEKRPKRGSYPNSHRATPMETERRDGEIAAKIQQIKEQMSHLNTQDKERPGNGILGSAPAHYNGRLGRPVNDETQLSSEARHIVNTIRNMQANTYHHEYRRQHSDAGRERRRDDRDDKRRPPLPRQLTDLSAGSWCRRSPAPVHPVLNHPRRPHPDTRNARR